MNSIDKPMVDYSLVLPAFNEEENVSVVRLHGNKIAEIDDNSMTIFDGGYQSKTTKSRLNALLSAFGMDGEYVFQKNFQWFVNYQGSPIPFFDGMRLA